MDMVGHYNLTDKNNIIFRAEFLYLILIIRCA